MAATVHIHKTHRSLTNGLETIHAEGTRVGECLESLFRQYPAMRGALLDNKGALRNVIEIYVNNETAYPDEWKKAVKDGDHIYLTVLLAGG